MTTAKQRREQILGEMTPRMKQLLTDAEAAGYTVSPGRHATAVCKDVGRWKKSRGLVIYANGTAFDISVDIAAAKGIRAYKAMRQVLGI